MPALRVTPVTLQSLSVTVNTYTPSVAVADTISAVDKSVCSSGLLVSLSRYSCSSNIENAASLYR